MRNYSLDSFKFIACFLVVFVHSRLVVEHYPMSEYITLIARLAVPLFLMISGFYYPILVKKEKIGGYFKKILHLTAVSTFVYMLIMPDVVMGMNLKGLAIWGLLNATPFGTHLWYMYSLVYVLIIFFFFKRIVLSKFNIWISIILILCNYALSFQPDYLLYRNFLFTGLPYMLLGAFIQQHKENIMNWKLTRNQAWGIFFVMGGLFIAEYSFYKHFEIQLIRDHYFMVYPLSFFIFASTLRFPNFTGKGFLSSWGQKYSTYIYVYHIIMIRLVNQIMKAMKEGGLLTSTEHNYLFPIIIVVLLIGVIYTYRKAKALFKKNKETT